MTFTTILRFVTVTGCVWVLVWVGAVWNDRRKTHDPVRGDLLALSYGIVLAGIIIGTIQRYQQGAQMSIGLPVLTAGILVAVYAQIEAWRRK
jgi:hypothetical protein